MDVQSIVLRLKIRTTQLVSLGEKPDPDSVAPTTNPDARGILTGETQIDFFKDARTDIKLKASNRRPAANSIVQPGFKFEVSIAKQGALMRQGWVSLGALLAGIYSKVQQSAANPLGTILYSGTPANCNAGHGHWWLRYRV